jgi:peptidoglycan hydrolase CwlO-like protein
MSTSEFGKQLHDKATRGMTLSTVEQEKLDAWYAQQDQEEGTLLAQTSSSSTLTTLQTQVDTVVARLLAVTQRLQEIETHNEALRRDIAALQRQLPHSSFVHSA